jgi:hypothetical protein
VNTDIHIMVDTCPLKIETVYPWFLERIRKVNTSKTRTTLRMDWVCTSGGHRVVEYCGVDPAGKPSEKLSAMFSRLGVVYPIDSLGTDAMLYVPKHITAKVQQHWQGEKPERVKYEFVMESIEPRPLSAPVRTSSVAPELKARVKKLVTGCKTLGEAQAKLEQIRKEYVPVLDELVAAGEVKFGG